MSLTPGVIQSHQVLTLLSHEKTEVLDLLIGCRVNSPSPAPVSGAVIPAYTEYVGSRV